MNTRFHLALSSLPLFLSLAVLTGVPSPASAQVWLDTWNQSTTGVSMSPEDVALDHVGHAYVANLNATVVHEFTTHGVIVDTLGDSGDGVQGSRGIAVDSQGRVYVGDPQNTRIRVYNSIGVHLWDWTIPGSTPGSHGTPYGVAVADSDTIYVVCNSPAGVQVFTPTGTLIRKWGSGEPSGGSGQGKFNDPHDVALDDSGYVYVSETGANRVQKLTRMGVFVRQWGSSGSTDGKFNSPTGLATDHHGLIYVVDTANGRIQVFDSSGGFVTKWGSPGSGTMEFNSPSGLTVGDNGEIFVADWGNGRVEKFGPAVTAVGPRATRAGMDLARPSPNPSAGPTFLSFSLPMAAAAALDIFDLQGRNVAMWHWSSLSAGSHRIEWNGRGEDGEPVAPGVLLCRFSAGGQVLTQRIVRVK